MSIDKAKTLLRSLRWYHLGFAFVWAITFAGLPSLGIDSVPQQLFSLGNQLCAIVAVGFAVLYERRHTPFPPRFALVLGVSLAAGSLVHWATTAGYLESSLGSLISGPLIGLSLGMSYVFWQQFFASEGASRTAIFIPLSALLSVLLSAVLSVMPDVVRVTCTVILLPVAATISLKRCLSEIVSADATLKLSPQNARQLIKGLWKPVFCTCAIGFVWKLTSHMFSVPGGATSIPILVGMLLAVMVVVLIELFSETGFAVLRLYQILFPLITGVFLLPTLLGIQYAPVLVGMLLFGFEIVNLLLIVTCAVYSSERNLPSTQVYAICMGPTLVAMLAGDFVGSRLSPYAAFDFTLAVNILFVCIYALSIVLFLVSFRRKSHKTHEPANQNDNPNVAVVGTNWETTSSLTESNAAENTLNLHAILEQKIDALTLVEPFSKREREVVGLVLRGNNTPAIARKLYISENTTRDHMKSIYRKANVHSRQELIDLLD